MPKAPHALQRACRAMAGGRSAARSWKVLLVVLIVAVSYLALAPRPPEGIDTGWDKLNHVLAFAALAFSARLAYPASRRAHTLLLCGLFAYGGLIELMQLFVAGRSAEWSDLLADCMGIAWGEVTAALVLRGAAAALAPGLKRGA